VPVEMTVFQLWEVCAGKVAACRVFMSEAEALEAAAGCETSAMYNRRFSSL
jgi:hypothetical protein